MAVAHPAGATPVRKETLVEIVGYAGAAAAVAGTVTAFARRTDLSDVASLVITLVVTAVLVVAGVAIGDRPPDAYQRMRSVLWFAAVGSFGVASGLFWSNIVDIGGKTSGMLAGVVTAVFGLVLWLVIRRSLQQIAFFLAAVGTVTAIATPSSFASTTDLNGPLLVIWVCGVAWFIAGMAEIVRPPRTACVVGAVVAVIATLEMFAPSLSLALTLMSLTSLVLLAAGDWKDDRAVAGLGIAGILLASAVGVVRAIGQSDGAALTAVTIGLVLLGGAIAAVRMGARADVPPPPGAEPSVGAGDRPPIPPPPAAY